MHDKEEDFIARRFGIYLEWYIAVTGEDAEIVEGRVRHAEMIITQPPGEHE